MNYRSVFAVCLVLGMVFASNQPVRAQEKEIHQKDLPAAVRAAFQKAYPKATIKGASMEVEKGVTLYEIESVEGTVARDISYKADGTVDVIEETMSAASLPGPVKDALAQHYPKSVISKYEKVIHGDAISYEMIVKTGKAVQEVVMDPAGKVVKVEKKRGEKEGKEAKEEEEGKD